jgi:prephenate dehydrogenase
MRVAVLGSSGGMGRLFSRYFLSRGMTVVGFDVVKTKFNSPNFEAAESYTAAVRAADVVLVATPIDKTVETVKEVAPALSLQTCVVEITSVKGTILAPLKELVARRRARLLSLHPLFGPSLGTRSRMRLCVVKTDPRSVSRARSLFPDATLIPMSLADHERQMAIVLSLTHLLNLAYAGVVDRFLAPSKFRSVQTPTSGVQLTLAEGVLSQNPSLYSYIQVENEHSSEAIEAFADEIAMLRRMVEVKDRRAFERHFRRLAKRFAGDSETAVDRIYQAFEKSTL